MTTHIFTRHIDIQNWVAGHKGLPAIRRVPDRSGAVRARLTFNFVGHHQPTPSTTPTQDDGITPVSWTAWLAELDRQHLALRVSQDDEGYEFIERKDLN